MRGKHSWSHDVQAEGKARLSLLLFVALGILPMLAAPASASPPTATTEGATAVAYEEKPNPTGPKSQSRRNRLARALPTFPSAS